MTKSINNKCNEQCILKTSLRWILRCICCSGILRANDTVKLIVRKSHWRKTLTLVYIKKIQSNQKINLVKNYNESRTWCINDQKPEKPWFVYCCWEKHRRGTPCPWCWPQPWWSTARCSRPILAQAPSFHQSKRRWYHFWQRGMIRSPPHPWSNPWVRCRGRRRARGLHHVWRRRRPRVCQHRSIRCRLPEASRPCKRRRARRELRPWLFRSRSRIGSRQARTGRPPWRGCACRAHLRRAPTRQRDSRRCPPPRGTPCWSTSDRSASCKKSRQMGDEWQIKRLTFQMRPPGK